MDNNFKNQDETNQNYHTYDNDRENYVYDGHGYNTAQSRLDIESKVQGVISKTFLFMFMVLLISMVSAYMSAATGLTVSLIVNKVYLPLLLVEIAVVFLANVTLQKDNVALSAFMLFVYSIVNGITLSTIFYVYTMGSIISIFLLAAIVFGCMAVYGLVTKKDLTALGTIGLMGLVGIIVLGIMNIFIQSDSLSIGLAAVGLAIFIGLTAYDLQKLKNMARANVGVSDNTLALYGALILYLDFINIFLKLLRLFGKRSN